jgi:hypothetical protein
MTISRASTLRLQLWRFKVDQDVYVRGWSQDCPCRVEHKLQGDGMVPHYQIIDFLGGRWTISQLELSSKPILTKENKK